MVDLFENLIVLLHLLEEHAQLHVRVPQAVELDQHLVEVSLII